MADKDEINSEAISLAIRDAGLSGRAICVHSSLRSFGRIAGGPAAIVDAFLAEGCTLMAPTFSDHMFMLKSQPGMRPARNAWPYGGDWDLQPPLHPDLVYRPDCQDIAAGMGKLPAAVLAVPGRVRGNHPLCSFTAVGPLAEAIISAQEPNHVYAPFAKLAELDGACVLMGLKLTSLTLLHWSEQLSGRTPFRRWANDPAGKPMMVEYGSCSEGFERLRPALAELLKTIQVGSSKWTYMNAGPVAHAAAAAMRRDSEITHCPNANCERCCDAVAGGPLSD
jgi:aminoglycoside N3'-acetyltransferase